MTRRVGIYVFDEIEVLDLGGPFEVFSTATRVQGRLRPDAAPAFEVFMIADAIRPIRARGGFVVLPHFAVGAHPDVHVLIVPGGVVTAELNREGIVRWIAQTSARAELTASVCTGAFLLARAGLLAGRPITTHWEDVEEFRMQFPGITVREDQRWVDTGTVVTSAGISAGIDMSLHLVARLESVDLAIRTARQMDYRWQRTPG